MTQIDELNIYKINLKIEKLKRLLEFIEKENESILMMINDNSILYSKTGNQEYKNKGKELTSELTKQYLKHDRLDMIIKKYEIEVKILGLDDLLKNEEIALINNSESLEGKYNIYEVNSQRKVGYITYSPTEYETEIGSIGYSVLPQYRGRNFAYKSLKLLTGYLSENGIEKISIAADINNTNSIRIMDKFTSDVPFIEELKSKDIKKYRYSIKNI